ncbi:MAG: endonuclease/exonuclease/phosphatase family protein [Chloroflexi bacterium]|nr:endonuclease/exonuclease/phosphatase family protein [Chloroflexota bacterium]
MSQNLRIATFNCENLFSRPRIFAEKKERSLELLGYVSLLQEELSKDVFDHKHINELKKKLSGYITINDVRGKHDKVAGAGQWLGWVEFTRHKADDVAVENTARVISDINADVICLIEVESRPILQKFHDDLLLKQFLQPAGKSSYEFILLIDGNDERGIDVAVMSRLPISWVRSHIHEKTEYNGKVVPIFSRDCLEVQIELSEERRLQLMVNHFKSMGYSPENDPQSNRRRREQVERVAELVSEHNLQAEYVVVAGDFNSDATSPSLSPLLEKEGLYNVNLKLETSQRGTYRTGKKQLDYLLVSDALKSALQDVYIERRGTYSRRWLTYDTVTGRRTEASDHSAVVANFRLA